MKTIDSIKTSLGLSIVILISSIILFLRRPDQFLNPAVWNESGSQILFNYIVYGFDTFFEPVNGYLVTTPKFIDGFSLLFGLHVYPYMAVIVTYLFTICTIILIYKAPTHLKSRSICCLVPLLVPVGGEVYMVSLYTFWWTIFWLAISFLWVETKNFKSIAFNNAIATIASLSSPMGIIFGPIFFVRMLLNRSIQNVSLVVSVGITASIQLIFILNSDRIGGGNNESVLDYINEFGLFFFFLLGQIEYYSDETRIICQSIGYIVILLFTAYIAKIGKLLDRYFIFLITGAVLSVLSYIVLVGPGVVHPTLAGPRYLFIPMSLFGWAIVWISTYSPERIRVAILSGVGILWLAATPSTFWRTHENIDWHHSVTSCFSGYVDSLPVHYEGNLSFLWYMSFPPQFCGQILPSSVFDRIIFTNKQTPEVEIINNASVGGGFPIDWLKSKDWIRNAVYDDSIIDSAVENSIIYGSYISGDSYVGDISIEVKQPLEAITLRYITGPGDAPINVAVYNPQGGLISRRSLSNPSDTWIPVTFAGNLRPGVRIVIADNGTGWGQWGAIAMAAE